MWIGDSDIPADAVRAFYAHMSDRFGASVQPKGTSGVMQAAAAGLALLGIQSREQFMSDYVTTMGRTVFVPYEVGSVGAWSPWQQIATMAHECQHIVQSDATGLVKHALDYATPAGRTRLECEAYTTSMELHHWHYGSIEGWWMNETARGMRHYGVGEIDQAVMRRHLMAAAPIVRRGGFVTTAATVAIEWLDTHLPEARAMGVASRARGAA